MRAIALLFGVFGTIGTTFADGGAGASSPAAVEAPIAVTATSVAAADPSAPRSPMIVVHRSNDVAAVGSRDAKTVGVGDSRVEVGGMRISVPQWARQQAPVSSNTPDTHGPSAVTARADGAIVMPSNTMGPGEAMWRVREREDTERRLAQAQADQAEAIADRLERERYDSDRNRGYGWRRFGFGYAHGWRASHHNGPRGPVTTTITRFNDLHSAAQRNFADAARPRGLFEAQEARDQAQQQFGRDSQPRINEAQRDRDEAFLRANRDNNQSGPTTVEVVPAK